MICGSSWCVLLLLLLVTIGVRASVFVSVFVFVCVCFAWFRDVYTARCLCLGVAAEAGPRSEVADPLLLLMCAVRAV